VAADPVRRPEPSSRPCAPVNSNVIPLRSFVDVAHIRTDEATAHRPGLLPFYYCHRLHHFSIRRRRISPDRREAVAGDRFRGPSRRLRALGRWNRRAMGQARVQGQVRQRDQRRHRPSPDGRGHPRPPPHCRGEAQCRNLGDRDRSPRHSRRRAVADPGEPPHPHPQDPRVASRRRHLSAPTIITRTTATRRFWCRTRPSW